MSNSQANEGVSVILGAITATGIGAFLLQGIGAILLGLLGGLGGYLFAKFLKPRLDRLFKKKNSEKA